MESNEGFLTEEEREMLDIAPQNLEVLVLSSSVVLWEHHVKAPGGGNASTAVRNVRRSHSGKHIQVKKDGAGGKGTWGKLLDTDGESHLDRNDPIYDSGEVKSTF